MPPVASVGVAGWEEAANGLRGAAAWGPCDPTPLPPLPGPLALGMWELSSAAARLQPLPLLPPAPPPAPLLPPLPRRSPRSAPRRSGTAASPGGGDALEDAGALGGWWPAAGPGLTPGEAFLPAAEPGGALAAPAGRRLADGEGGSGIARKRSTSCRAEGRLRGLACDQAEAARRAGPRGQCFQDSNGRVGGREPMQGCARPSLMALRWEWQPLSSACHDEGLPLIREVLSLPQCCPTQ